MKKSNLILKLQKLVIGEKKHEERMVHCDRFSILCYNPEENIVVLRDKTNHNIYEISILELLKRKCVLYCKTCMTSKCEHSIYMFYADEVTRLKKGHQNLILYAPEPIRRRIQNKIVYTILRYNIVPVIFLTVVSLALLPFFTIPNDPYWYTMNDFIDQIFVTMEV